MVQLDFEKLQDKFHKGIKQVIPLHARPFDRGMRQFAESCLTCLDDRITGANDILKVRLAQH